MSFFAGSDVEAVSPVLEAVVEPEPPAVPRLGWGGYVYMTVHEREKTIGRVQDFRGNRVARCYKHRDCCWIAYPRDGVPTQHDMLSWIVEGLEPSIMSKIEHLQRIPEELRCGGAAVRRR